MPTFRRGRLAAAIAPIILATLLGVASAAPATALLPGSTGPITQACGHIRWRNGPDAIERLIRCATRKWPVPGGTDYALRVAFCESKLDAHARSRTGTYLGVFQQSRTYWPARARAYGFPGWSPLNGHANVIVSVRMAHDGGWAAWECAR